MQLISLLGTNKLPYEPNSSESGIFFFKHPLTITTSFVCVQFKTFITSTIVGSVGVDTGLCTSSVCCGTFINIYKAKPNHFKFLEFKNEMHLEMLIVTLLSFFQRNILYHYTSYSNIWLRGYKFLYNWK